MDRRKGESRLPTWCIRPLLLGLIVGALTILIVLLILSAISASYDIPAAVVVPLAMVANAFGAFLSGFVSARSYKRNGWLLGLVSAFALFVFSTAAGFRFIDESDGSFLPIKISIMLACGMVGGILAINTGKRYTKR